MLYISVDFSQLSGYSQGEKVLSHLEVWCLVHTEHRFVFFFFPPIYLFSLKQVPSWQSTRALNSTDVSPSVYPSVSLSLYYWLVILMKLQLQLYYNHNAIIMKPYWHTNNLFETFMAFCDEVSLYVTILIGATIDGNFFSHCSELLFFLLRRYNY